MTVVPKGDGHPPHTPPRIHPWIRGTRPERAPWHRACNEFPDVKGETLRFSILLLVVLSVFNGACSRAPSASREARAAEKLLESVRKPVAHRARPFARPEIPDA